MLSKWEGLNRGPRDLGSGTEDRGLGKGCHGTLYSIGNGIWEYTGNGPGTGDQGPGMPWDSIEFGNVIWEYYAGPLQMGSYAWVSFCYSGMAKLKA